MAISREEVLHVAKLARLALTEEEVARYTGQLGAILGYVEQLKKVDVEGVEPTVHPAGDGNGGRGQASPVREDEQRPGLTNQEALANAPQAAEGFFRVPPVIE